MNKPFKDWDNFDIILAIILTAALFPWSMIYWFIRGAQGRFESYEFYVA